MRLLIAVALIVLLGAPVAHARFGQPFEGTRWKVTVTPDDGASNAGEKEFSDTFVFKGGNFTSESLQKRGFEPAEYQEEMAPGGITATFTSESKNKQGDVAKWRGTKSAADMRGELTLRKSDGTEHSYSFHAERMNS